MEKTKNILEAIEIIKNARIKLSLTQSDTAERLGIGLRQYQKIEDGNFPKFKTQQVKDLENILSINIYELIYEYEVPSIKENKVPYHLERRENKIKSGPLMVPLIAVSAQAGYSKSYNNSDFINKLDYYPIVPGIDHHGAIWRYFQVKGDSMLDFLNDGDYVLSSQVPNEDWKDLKDYLVYVIVTDSIVTVKYAVKRNDELILIPRNEKFKQIAVKISDVKEIWKYRRHIGWNASSPQKLKINI